MALNIILSIVGFAMLMKCADFFVDGVSSFAKTFKIPSIIVGLTIVAFATSAPEAAISFNAHITGNHDILFGNIIGSNITNISVILGVAIVIVPIKTQTGTIKYQIPILLLIVMGLSVLLLDDVFQSSRYNSLSRADGLILILFFSVFVYYLAAVFHKSADKEIEEPKFKLPKAIVFMSIGLAGIIFGSDLLVNNIAAFAASLGISQKIVSVTIISIGTSLPELVTMVVAAKKGENNIAIGTLVGSNIFNTCIALGLPVIILGEAATSAFSYIDAIFMLVSVALLWIFSATDKQLKRHEGVILILVYCAYCVYLFR